MLTVRNYLPLFWTRLAPILLKDIPFSPGNNNNYQNKNTRTEETKMLPFFLGQKKRTCTAHDLKSSSDWDLPPKGDPTQLPKPLTRRRIPCQIAAAFLAVAVVIVVLSVPVIVMQCQRSGQYDDPSYHNGAYHPINVLDDFPDPGMVRFNGTWFAYGSDTGTGVANAVHVPVATSDDFVVWHRKLGHDALPILGDWEEAINQGAPDVIQRVSSLLPP